MLHSLPVSRHEGARPYPAFHWACSDLMDSISTIKERKERKLSWPGLLAFTHINKLRGRSFFHKSLHYETSNNEAKFILRLKGLNHMLESKNTVLLTSVEGQVLCMNFDWRIYLRTFLQCQWVKLFNGKIVVLLDLCCVVLCWWVGRQCWQTFRPGWPERSDIVSYKLLCVFIIWAGRDEGILGSGFWWLHQMCSCGEVACPFVCTFWSFVHKYLYFTVLNRERAWVSLFHCMEGFLHANSFTEQWLGYSYSVIAFLFGEIEGRPGLQQRLPGTSPDSLNSLAL